MCHPGSVGKIPGLFDSGGFFHMFAATPAPWASLYRDAVAFHQRGQLAQAQQRYQQILRQHPQHHQALHLLGVIAAQQQNYREAADLIGKAISVFPGDANYYINHGNACRALGQLDVAMASYGKAVELQPSNPQAQASLGAVFQGMGRLDDAIARYDTALRLKPDLFEALYNRAVALQSARRPLDALAGYERALAVLPDFVDGHFRRGVVLQELGRADAAVCAYDRVVALQPTHAEAFYNRGYALVALKRFEEAIVSYDQAIAVRPDFAQAHCNRGVALQGVGRLDEALLSLDRAIDLVPEYSEALNNRGVVLHAMQRSDEALATYEKVLAVDPRSVSAFINRGVTLHACGQLDAAMSSYAQAIAIEPDAAEAHFYQSLILLLRGEFHKGWQEYQWFWKTENGAARLRAFTQPTWTGREPVAGKRVLVHSEQGLGDMIQFCRYVRLLAARGAHVILELPASLVGLLRGLDGVSECVVKGEPLPHYDFQCLLLSLPPIFQADVGNIPTPHPYIHGDPAKVAMWQERLGPRARTRVGLVWSGSHQHMNDAHRSLPLSTLLRQLPSGFDYVSLQKELRTGDMDALACRPDIRRFDGEIGDFTDTAALCELMDVVISVDTSVAHLSAALGRPTWILLAAVPDWRWLLVREDSPWYQSVRLFRQSQPGDWGGVLQAVAQQLPRLQMDQVR